MYQLRKLSKTELFIGKLKTNIYARVTAFKTFASINMYVYRLQDDHYYHKIPPVQNVNHIVIGKTVETLGHEL